MELTEPKVYLVARPSIVLDEGLLEYLGSIGADNWSDKRFGTESGATTDAEKLVEIGGRLCYRSFEPGLNPNVTRVREDPAVYFENILRSGHGSVLEHAYFSFICHNVSLVFTHEMVRHRAGWGFSQESLRFVRLSDIRFRVPEALTHDVDTGEPLKYQGSEGVELVEDLISRHVEEAEQLQQALSEVHGLDDESNFHRKKEVTSAMRRVAPNGLSTTILMTGNIRAIRQVIEMRTAGGAEEEIRTVIDQVGRIMRKECPLLFRDYERSDEGEWTTPYRKV